VLPGRRLTDLARRCGWRRRRPRKIDPRGLLCSCLALTTQPLRSLRDQAIVLGWLGHRVVSKQAVHQRLGPPATAFLRGVLAALLAHRWPAATARQLWPRARLLVQDSTCLSLAPGLRAWFPGPANATAAGAAVRVQCLYEVGAERFLRFAVSAFTRNDQAAAADVLADLRPGDLLVRDLGYFSLPVWQAIGQRGAFFLSRWRHGVTLLCPHRGQPLALRRLLRPGCPLDLPVLLGGDQRLPVRLLAFPLPEELANRRRQQARTNRDRRLHPTAEHLYLLSWYLFLTNAPAQRLPWAQARQLYGLRWRIETVFKSWKSHLGLLRFARVGRRQIEPLLYALLIVAVLLHVSWQPWLAARHPASGHSPPALSLLRLAGFFASGLAGWFAFHDPPVITNRALFQQLFAHCRYDHRRRPNYATVKTPPLS
jgi:hypothetical protein